MGFSFARGFRSHSGAGFGAVLLGYGVGGRGRCRLPGSGVSGWPGCQVRAVAVGVIAGLLLSALVVCVSELFFLSLLATARGGASFLCPKRQRNEAKKALSKRGLVS